MISTRARAWVRRRVAVLAVEEARAAWRKARATPDEAHTRAALYACVLAVRSLRRASEDQPADDEMAMLEEAWLIAEVVVDLKRKLARILQDQGVLI